jgi:hypothetical protein
MSGSPLKKFVVTPLLVSAAVYATLSLPLAVLGPKPVTIKLQEEPIFYGQIKDVAPPYLALASIVSLGAGIASVASVGWRQSSRKASEVKAQLLNLEQDLKEKEKQLEALKLSQSRLEASGLNEFLDEEATQQPANQTLNASQSTQFRVEPLAIATQPIETQVVVTPQPTVPATAKFTTAQSFQGYSQAKASVQPNYQVSQLSSPQVEELHTQLQHLMAQMVSVQTALSAARSTGKPEAQVPANTISH